ncbi:MAG: HTH domain-containing protein [Nanoarchaeota archaeon]|mgnify:CR=1 FL=1
MKRIEEIYREILFEILERNRKAFTQSEMAKKLGISLSGVNIAIKRLDSLGAVKIQQRNFYILDIKKIIYLWASIRNLKKDIIFQARIDAPVREIERILPDIFYTAYSAYKLRFSDVPADYSEVYVYAEGKEFEAIRKRILDFKVSEGSKSPNFFVLKKDNSLNLYKEIPLAQIFVDLWNLKEWYAKDFINAMEGKLGI